MMAILLAETLITLGAAAQRWCQLQETGVPLTDAIILQSAAVPVVGARVIKSFFHACCFVLLEEGSDVGRIGSGDVGVIR